MTKSYVAAVALFFGGLLAALAIALVPRALEGEQHRDWVTALLLGAWALLFVGGCLRRRLHRS